MARSSREDEPGTWHRVMNRAIARRTMLEDRADVRYFLSRLAKEVRRGEIEVHAWCFMTTHYHLLVRSLEGRLSEAMRRAQNQYVRHFNRRYRRDGPLMRGRFRSKPVETETYRRVLLRYIDHNPVKAGLVRRPWDYPWGSAAEYVGSEARRWHETSWIDRIVDEERAADEPRAIAYARRSARGLEQEVWDWVEERAAFSGPSAGDLDHLILSSPAGVQNWMQRKAALADGHTVGEPVASLGAVARIAERYAEALGTAANGGRPVDVGMAFRVAMCRLLASATWEEIANQVGRTASSCASSFKRNHARLMDDCEPYRQAASRAAMEVARAMSGG